ncbi:MAG: RIP metalloprotease RseP [Acidobacteria bacterium]|nr:RIP metalloprotease RseP [Acidobacteriota bacterium]MYD70083.1 RIP metalloprotease RseP [Acidobacteriota bacterium]
MTSLLAFLFVLGVLVFVHELGHFVVARRLGVRVLTFSLGFGPKIVNAKRGDTEYCISAIPLGGYVKMAGESLGEARTGGDDEFMSKTKWERFLILIAGPAMNLILAVLVMWGVLYQGAEVPAYEQEPPVVGRVVDDSPAARAGIRVGEQIVSVAGRAVETWDDLFVAVMPRAEREIAVVVRDTLGRERTLDVVPAARTEFEMGDLGVGPEMRPQIISVAPGDPADRAGLQVGDLIVAIDGADVAGGDFVDRISSSADRPLALTIRRGDRTEQVRVTPEMQGDRAMIGVGFSPYELQVVEPGFFEAFSMSLERNYEWSGLIFQTLAGLLTAETSPRQLVGPVGIAQLSGGAAQVGWVALFSLMAMISLNLGILNLLPIPILDGGHIFIMAMEGVSRRDFSIRVKERMLLAGFVVLMMLMVTVIYNDLTRIEWIEAFMPWR